MTATRYRFNGADYQAERDNLRLAPQHERIRDLMLDGEWRTLDQIAEATNDPVASVSAQLRHLRKPRFGSYRVDRRHVGAGLYEYRVQCPVPEPPPVSVDEHGGRLFG